MVGKRILAVIFAALILIKLAFLLIKPEKWLGLAQLVMGYSAVATIVYLILLVITGYFIFTSLNLIDVAVVMLFTSLLIGLNLIPYAASLQKITQEIAITGLGKAWLALIIWVAIAMAVLYRAFAKE